MKIGFLCSEYFGYRHDESRLLPSRLHGGFGYLTKKKCEELAKLGHEVHAFIPDNAFLPISTNGRNSLESIVMVNGVTLHLYKDGGFTTHRLKDILMTALKPELTPGQLKSLNSLLQRYQVDILQSEEPGLYTVNGLKWNKNPVVVFQDPYDDYDLRSLKEAVEIYGSLLPDFKFKFANNPLSVMLYYQIFKTRTRNMNRRLLNSLDRQHIYAEAKFIARKVQRIYDLEYEPEFLPNPIDVPEELPLKSDKASILFLARWDPVKRVDIALRVAKNLPEYDFYFVGVPNGGNNHNDRIATLLQNKYRNYPNIHVLGFVDEKKKLELLDKAWILLNTSMREGLPMSFLEAAAHGLAIVSSVDPDGYASGFGRHVQEGKFEESIKVCIKEECYKDQGKKAYEYVSRVHNTNVIMRRHIDIYERLLN